MSTLHAAIVELAQDREFQALFDFQMGRETAGDVERAAGLVEYFERRGIGSELAEELALCFMSGYAAGVGAADRVLTRGLSRMARDSRRPQL